MRVLLITAVLPPRDSPEADYAAVIAEDLAARGHEVHVLTGRRAVTPMAGAHVHARVPGWGWDGLPTVAMELGRVRPDVIVLLYLGFLYQRHPMATTIPALTRLLRPRTAVVTVVSDPVAGAVARRRWRTACAALERLAGRPLDPEWGSIAIASDRLTTTSWSRARDLGRRLGGRHPPIDVIPAPVLVRRTADPARARREERARLGARPEEVLLIFFGYLYTGKGLEDLVEALARLRDAGTSLRLVIAGGMAEIIGGDVYAEQIRAIIRTRGLEPQVIWAGSFESGSDTASRWLSAADIAVFPPGMGIQVHNTAVGAAAAHGLPILATAGADTERAIFVHGENAHLVAPRDPGALATGLRLLAEDEPLRTRLAEGSRRIAERWYARRRATDLLEGTLERAVSSRRGRRRPG